MEASQSKVKDFTRSSEVLEITTSLQQGVLRGIAAALLKCYDKGPNARHTRLVDAYSTTL